MAHAVQPVRVSADGQTTAVAALKDEGDMSFERSAAEDLPLRTLPLSMTEDSAIYPDVYNLQREPKLLLVDDNAINLKVLGMFARKCSKLPSTPAGGGKAAIEEFKAAYLPNPDAHPFDIILLDLSMPEVSGFDVAATIREMELEVTHQKIPRTHIVALTGLVSDKDRDAAFAAGLDEYVTKPASLKDLQKVVENWRIVRGLV